MQALSPALLFRAAVLLLGGSLLAAIGNAFTPAAAVTDTAQAWTTYRRQVSDGRISIAVGPDGVLWVGTSAGAARFDGTTWTDYPKNDGPAGSIRDLAINPNGLVWFATTGGASRFDGKVWTTHTEPGACETVAVAPDGTVWVGTMAGVSRFDGKTWTTYTANDGLPYLSAMAVAADGALWLGVEGAAIRFDGKAWSTYQPTVGAFDSGVIAIAVGRDGAMWFGEWHWERPNGASRFDGRQWRKYGTRDRLAHGNVHGIAFGPDGAASSGLSRPASADSYATRRTAATQIDRRRRVVLLLEVNTVAEHHRPVEREARFGAVPATNSRMA